MHDKPTLADLGRTIYKIHVIKKSEVLLPFITTNEGKYEINA